MLSIEAGLLTGRLLGGLGHAVLWILCQSASAKYMVSVCEVHTLAGGGGGLGGAALALHNISTCTVYAVFVWTLPSGRGVSVGREYQRWRPGNEFSMRLAYLAHSALGEVVE